MSQIDWLPPLREVIATHELNAKKALGQNFLLDLNLTAKIARSAGDLSSSDILEIGPGPGGLTRGLMAEGARKVLAIEKDSRCLPALAEIAAAYPGRLEVIEGDALKVDPLDDIKKLPVTMWDALTDLVDLAETLGPVFDGVDVVEELHPALPRRRQQVRDQGGLVDEDRLVDVLGSVDHPVGLQAALVQPAHVGDEIGRAHV